ncbi:MAG TPA: hypothetical protein VH834_03415, partial [Solirubrobacteraceae bacterium]
LWYEKDNSNIGLRNNEQVFAAKIVADPKADGGFNWRAVGSGTAGQVNTLDTTGSNGFGNCAASPTAEDACSLNKNPLADAEDPRVAAGTLTPGSTTVPWVAFSEDVGGHHAIFVSRLVNGDHFELFNGGNPVSGPEDAGTPDITFFGNTPYVSWVGGSGTDKLGYVGHFDSYGNFVTDTPGGIRLNPYKGGPAPLIDARVALSSNCTADPFTADGTNCAPAAVNAAFDTFTTAGSPQRLFSQALTGGPNCVLFYKCQLIVRIHHHKATIYTKFRKYGRFGIIVDKVGKHGNKRVGRVPLGTHPRSTLRLSWDLKVNGHRLRPGHYQVTGRALNTKGKVQGLTRPVRITVR